MALHSFCLQLQQATVILQQLAVQAQQDDKCQPASSLVDACMHCAMGASSRDRRPWHNGHLVGKRERLHDAWLTLSRSKALLLRTSVAPDDGPLLCAGQL